MSCPRRCTSVSAAAYTGLVSGGSEPTLSFIPYVLTSVKEWMFYYVWRLFLPVHLSVDPESNPILRPASSAVLIACVVIAGLIVLAYALSKRDRLLAAFRR